ALISKTHPSDRLQSSWPRLVDLETLKTQDLKEGWRGWHNGLALSPSGRRLAAQQTERPESQALGERRVVVYEEGKARVLGRTWDRWPVPMCFLDERRLVVSFHEEGEIRLAVLDVEEDRRKSIEGAGSADAVRSVGRRVVGIGQALGQPPRLVAIHTDSKTRAWLPDLSGWTDAETRDWRVERLRVEATDGATVDTRLVLPPGDGPHPTLLWIHGGPINQFGNVWHWRWNPLVMLRAGYAVALPNARGSTGYGYEYAAGIWGNKWGAQCYADLMQVADVLDARSDLDSRRMVAMGGSFGGYMTNWIGGQTDRFAALVTHAGLFDFRAFYGTTDHPAYWALHQQATPWEGDIDRYSPHAHVGAWKSPTLILHGEKDYRVPIGEALALFEALQAHGIDSELVVFPDENHWILKPRNIRVWYETVLRFLDERLQP
ncbi:MAG: S9 family peptidase, partial [Myxococcota bacterium]